MPGLTMETARQLLASTTTEDHLFEHAIGVSAAMGAMARHFGADEEYWKAVGYLHDYDFEQFPDEHLRHTEQPLRDAGVDETLIHAVASHGWGMCSEVEPVSDMEKTILTGEDAMYLSYSRDVMKIMTKLRQDWGMKYPEEE